MQNLKKEFSIVLKKIKSGGGQKGISLYLAVIIMAILLSVALGITTILLGQMRVTRGMEESTMAFFAADSGIEKVMYSIYNNNFQPSYSGPPGDPTYTVTLVCGKDYIDCPAPLVRDFSCSAPYFCIKSVGKYKEVKRAIEVTR